MSGTDPAEQFMTSMHGTERPENAHVADAAGNAMRDRSNNAYGEQLGGMLGGGETPGGAAAAAAHPSGLDDMLKEDSKHAGAEAAYVRQQQAVLRAQAAAMERERLIDKYERLDPGADRRGIEALNPQSLAKRVHSLQSQKRSRFMIKVMRRALCFATRLAETVAANVDPEHGFVHLVGWCDHFTANVQSYDHLLYDIYDYYLLDMEANPIAMLVCGMASNAAMYSMKQKLLSNPILSAVHKHVYGGGAGERKQGGAPDDASIHIDDIVVGARPAAAAPDVAGGGAGAAKFKVGLRAPPVEDDDDILSLDTRE